MTVASRRAKRAHGGSDRALHLAPVADRPEPDGRTIMQSAHEPLAVIAS